MPKQKANEFSFLDFVVDELDSMNDHCQFCDDDTKKDHFKCPECRKITCDRLTSPLELERNKCQDCYGAI